MTNIFQIEADLLSKAHKLSLGMEFDLRFPKVLFRGVDDASYTLLASAVRDNQKCNVLSVEQRMLNDFRSQLKAKCSQWEALTLAQHYGMQTRLLDWTSNPFVALYFAVRENKQKDGRVWGLLPKRSHYEVSESVRSPFPKKGGHEGTLIFKPFIKSSRIISQSGYLMRQVYEDGGVKPVDQNAEFAGRTFSITIKSSMKQILREELGRCCITNETMFPYDAMFKDEEEGMKEIVSSLNKMIRGG